MLRCSLPCFSWQLNFFKCRPARSSGTLLDTRKFSMSSKRIKRILAVFGGSKEGSTLSLAKRALGKPLRRIRQPSMAEDGRSVNVSDIRAPASGWPPGPRRCARHDRGNGQGELPVMTEQPDLIIGCPGE